MKFYLNRIIIPIRPRAQVLPRFSSRLSLRCTFHSKNSNSVSILQSLPFAITTCFSIHYCGIIHSVVLKSLRYRDGFIGDRLVSLYSKLGYFLDAEHLFEEMPDKDLVSWNSWISVLSRSGYLSKSLDVFRRMRCEVGMEPNEVTLISILSACTDMGAFDCGNYIHGFAKKMGLLSEVKVSNSLINMYGQLGCLASACYLFETMVVPSLVSWNSIIKIYVQNWLCEEGIGLFKSMRRAGIYPDQTTMVTLLQGCGDIGIGYLADMFHCYIIAAGFDDDVTIMTGLVNVYTKSGRLTASDEVFRGMKDPDSIAWTAMLASYAVHGYGREAIDLFDTMVNKGQEPDHVTFTHLLSACSHAGLVEEGKRFFKIMSCTHNVEPRLDHYSCMVDLLGRSGNLREAHALIKSMPMEPNSGVWGSLLNACKIYGNMELGKEVAEKLIALNPSDSRNYIMLSNIYSAAGQWRDASETRKLMMDRHIIRTAGFSLIEHGRKIHRFVVGDQLHPEKERIYTKLEELIKKIQKAGYVPQTEFVLHDLDKKVKENMITKHSEKLAVAFGHLVTAAGLPLIIVKNLRICGDCHNMAKFVSLTEKRRIIIRDVKRFHHFSEGSCSCGDYWFVPGLHPQLQLENQT